MTFDWEGKFVNAGNLIKEFKMYISTFPGGKCVLIIIDQDKLKYSGSCYLESCLLLVLSSQSS